MNNQSRREAISIINQTTVSEQQIIESRVESSGVSFTSETNQFRIITKLNRILAIEPNNFFIQGFKDKVAQGDYDYNRLFLLEGGYYCLEEVLNHIYIRVQNENPRLFQGQEETLKPDIEVWIALLNN
jgi:hypothetical protein